MIEVVPAGCGTGFRWHFICHNAANPRVLVQGQGVHPTDRAAWADAARWRAAFWRIADAVDHRMARCI